VRSSEIRQSTCDPGQDSDMLFGLESHLGWT